MNKFVAGVRVAFGIFDIFCFLVLSFVSLASQFGLIFYFFLGVGYLILANNLFTRSVWARRTLLFIITPLSVLAAINIIAMGTSMVPSYFRMPLTAQIGFTVFFVAIPLVLNAMCIFETPKKRAVLGVIFLALFGVLTFCLTGGEILERKKGSSSLNTNEFYKYYYEESGELWQEVNYVNGKLHGEYKMYHKNGELAIRSNYINGKEDGTSERYYENGQVSSIDHFRNGIRDGLSRFFYETGELMREISYKDGNEIKNRFYDKNDNLVSEDNKLFAKLKEEVAMKVTSPAFGHNQTIPGKYTCQGEDINPPLAISGIPEGTKSLALIVDDPDAPGGNWDHWLVYNISPAVEIKENSVPGTQTRNDFGRVNYGGPCPPSGTHRYFFKLYALDTTLVFKGAPSKEALEKAMQGHILEKAELIGLYQKTR